MTLSAGEHTLKWAYTKDGSVDGGSDTAWIDNVVLPAVIDKAEITSPSNGSTLSGASVTFRRNAGIGVTDYKLCVGSSQGAQDIYAESTMAGTSQNISGIPVDGSTVHVRLYSRIGSVWYHNDYSYTAATTGGGGGGGGSSADITIGSAIQVSASGISGIDSFPKKTQLLGEYRLPGKSKNTVGKCKILPKLKASQTSFRGIWSANAYISKTKTLANAYKSGRTASSVSISSHLSVDMTVTVNKVSHTLGTYRLVAPSVTGVKAGNTNVTSASAGDVLTIEGDYFSSSAPNIWLEYSAAGKTRTLKLKVISHSMNSATGASTTQVQVPAKLPKGWVHGQHDLVVANKVGWGYLTFNTTP
jgi:hypothetical protein